MKIEAVHLRRFRGLQNASLNSCAGVNVLIGKNNSGKSSVLAAIEFALGTIKTGKIANRWDAKTRPIDDFHNRDASQPFEIGLTFELDASARERLTIDLINQTIGLEHAVERLSAFDLASVILNGEINAEEPYLCVKTLGLGPINSSGETLSIDGALLFAIDDEAAAEFIKKDRDISSVMEDISRIDGMERSSIQYAFREGPPSSRARRLRELGMRYPASPQTQSEIESLAQNSETFEDFDRSLAQLKASLKRQTEDVEKREIACKFSVFSGTTGHLPQYVTSFLKGIGAITTQSFKEIRPPIGFEEAAQLLQLKTKRGGAEALAGLQRTVKSLLGVTVDAFEPEFPSSQQRRFRRVPEAEMDIDNFLVDANGAVIREALRIILDLELGSPSLALIEEPEVHLHPGLERVLHNYLISKSKSIQLFITTHSANFLDSSTRQNVYLLKKRDNTTADVHKVASEEDLINIVNEVGIKPSTVLMFERLLFVEGQSDEEIITELCKRLSIDLSLSNTAFVKMGGSSRMHHYLSDPTVEILSRRQIKVWFLIDRDERDEEEIKGLLARLGSNSQLKVLERRELENYLLQPSAIRSLIEQKTDRSLMSTSLPSDDELAEKIKKVTADLLEPTIELVTRRSMLKPLYANLGGNNIEDKLTAMGNEISRRLDTYMSERAATEEKLRERWDTQGSSLAPGSLILDAVMKQYGLRYRKEADAQRLAEAIDVDKLDAELKRFFQTLSS